MQQLDHQLQEQSQRLQLSLPSSKFIPSDGKAFITSLEAPRVVQSPAPEIVDILMACMHMVGLRSKNMPSDEEFAMLVSFARQQYGNHTCAEIKHAFTLAITNQLDLEPNEIPCYENFSRMYFAKIMGAYRSWASQQHKQYVDSIPPPELPAPRMTVWDMRRWLVEQAIAVGTTLKNPELLPVELYDWLITAGKIAPSTAAKWRIAEQAVARRQAWLIKEAQEGTTRDKDRLSDFMAMKSWGFQGSEKRIIQELGKRIILWHYLYNFYQIFLNQHNGTTV